MNPETREQIALARYKLISPVLAEPGRVQNEYFRSQSEKEHELPHAGRRRLSVSTLKLWLRRYRERGFEGLKPRARADQAGPGAWARRAWPPSAASARPTPTGRPSACTRTCWRATSWATRR